MSKTYLAEARKNLTTASKQIEAGYLSTAGLAPSERNETEWLSAIQQVTKLLATIERLERS